MSSLKEIEAAAETLTAQQQRELLHFLVERLAASQTKSAAHLIRQNGDSLLEAPADAPPMTAKQVSRMLEDWP